MPRFCYCCVTLPLFLDRNPNQLHSGTAANTKASQDALFLFFSGGFDKTHSYVRMNLIVT